jgi:hypothetical protein
LAAPRSAVSSVLAFPNMKPGSLYESKLKTGHLMRLVEAAGE